MIPVPVVGPRPCPVLAQTPGVAGPVPLPRVLPIGPRPVGAGGALSGADHPLRAVADWPRRADGRAGGPLVPLGGRRDLLRVRGQRDRALPCVEQFRPVDAHVVELAGRPPRGAHEVRDDQGGRGPPFRLGSQARAQGGSDPRAQARQIRLALHDAQDGGLHVPAAERGPARGAGQQGRAPRPPVAVAARRAPREQFGSRVAGGPRDEAGAGQVLVLGAHGDAEVDEDGPALGADDVGGLDIAVDDVRPVDGGDRRCQVVGQRRDSPHGDRTRLDDFGQGGARDVLRDDEGLRGVGLRVDDVRHERAPHGVDRPRLAAQAGARRVGGGQGRVQRFEGDGSAAAVLRQPHGARAPCAEPADQTVSAEVLSFFHPSRLQGAPHVSSESPSTPRRRPDRPGGNTPCTRHRSAWYFLSGDIPGTVRGRSRVGEDAPRTPTTDRPARTCRWEGIAYGNRHLRQGNPRLPGF